VPYNAGQAFAQRAETADIGPYVVGGTPAAPGEIPFQAALYVGSSPATGQFCGGSLVAPRFVVTAGHCQATSAHPNINVLLGRVTLSGTGGEEIQVVKATRHPMFNGSTLDNDVTVLELATPSAQTPVQWVVPGQESYWTGGTISTVSGWGAVREGGPGSNTLLKADVPVVSDADCAAAEPDFHPATMMCAGILDTGGVDTCQGDSGGPLTTPGPGGNKLLVGITSWGIGCARPNHPGIYTRVAAYASFIESIVSGGGGETVPGAPERVGARGGPGTIKVVWKAPTDDGGSPILMYRVTTSPATTNITVPATQLKVTLNGLTPDTYTVRVRAVNAIGGGPAGAATATVT
jgi:secreted trypsin-like serine protease